MHKQFVIRISAIIAILVFSYHFSYAQSSVSISDTLIPRGQTYKIPVSGSTSQSVISNLRITLRYNARVIDIKSALGSGNFIMNCTAPVLSAPNFINIDSATIDISCDSITASNSDTICLLEVEGLAGSDSLTMLTPIAVYENGIQVSNPLLEGAILKVPGVPVYQRFPEGLGQNYPNPFSSYTFFPVSIYNSTKVDFKIFAVDGTEVLTNEEFSESLQLYRVTANGKVKIDRFETVLDKGNYILSFLPDIRLASGSYFLVMQTDNNIYNKRFLYLK